MVDKSSPNTGSNCLSYRSTISFIPIAGPKTNVIHFGTSCRRVLPLPCSYLYSTTVVINVNMQTKTLNEGGDKLRSNNCANSLNFHSTTSFRSVVRLKTQRHCLSQRLAVGSYPCSVATYIIQQL